MAQDNKPKTPLGGRVARPLLRSEPPAPIEPQPNPADPGSDQGTTP